MKVYNVPSSVVLFSHNDYGARLLFKNGITNPRDLLGKNGVTTHSWLASFFYKTIQIEATVVNENGKEKTKKLYINHNSLIKYLGKTPEQIKSDDQLIFDLHACLWSNDKEQKDILNHREEGLQHAGKHNHHPLNRFIDYIRGSFLGFLYQKTIISMHRIVLRFLVVRTESDLLDAGETLAVQRFNESYQNVPAYKAHIGAIAPLTFDQIPLTDKDNYIKKQTYDSDTHFFGKYPNKSKTDTSTGTTGKPTEWVRGEQELQTVKHSLDLAAQAQFGERKIHYINAFALGPWATGLTTYELMRETGSVFATGADKGKILDKLQSIISYEKHQLDLAVSAFSKKKHLSSADEFLMNVIIEQALRAVLKKPDIKLDEEIMRIAMVFDGGDRLINAHKSSILAIATILNQEKQQIVIAGYPPFLKDLSDYAEAKHHPLSDFCLVGVVGGQAISEAMRDQLISHGFNKVYSSYGASDLDINLGVESDYEILVRKTIENNPNLARELYGVNKGLPMIFHYDPMNYHVECQEGNELIFTCTRNDRSSPRVRYDLGDKGRVYASSDVQALLQKYGVFQKPKTHLPFMFVWGRDSTVVFHGANLAFTELERAITESKELEHDVLKKAFYTYEDAQGVEHLEIWLELNEGVELPNPTQSKEQAQFLITYLAQHNQDFSYQIDHLGENETLPAVRFFLRGKSPISEADGHRKQVLIFKKNVNLAANYEFPGTNECSVAEVIKQELLSTSSAACGIK
jgi:phenylacetate-coenzyme A ligase PaaK-like adenylate-forming protein